MKYLKLFESFEDIHKICTKYNIKNYTINTDGSIDVDERVVDLRFEKLTKLPLKFNKVNGSFYCSQNNLTSLEGSPKEVNHNFFCYNNKLTSFKGAPKIIRLGFYCENNKINSFEYFPGYVRYEIICDNNPIWEIWRLFYDFTKIELLNDFDIFRDEDKDEPVIIMDRLNDFLLTIGRPEVSFVDKYKNI